MKPNDILKEVLKDPRIKSLLSVKQSDLISAHMDISSPNDNIEVIKAIIKGGYNGVSPQQTFKEIRRIKQI